MKLTCVECKNEVNLSNASEVVKDAVVECNHCGITLLVLDTDGEEVTVEVMDEGK